MSLPYSPYVDRQSNPIANQGRVDAGAAYDMGAKLTIQAENADTPSLYGGAQDEAVWNITDQDLLYSVPGKHGSSGSTQLSVLPALNGLGVEASVIYPNDPAMVREAVKNSIQYIGAAYQALSAERSDAARGINVQIGGLKTLRMGAGAGDNFIKPGDLVCAEVPLPGRVYTFSRNDSVRSQTGRGVPPNKTTLQLRRCSHKTAGTSLRLHIQKILEDPAKWKLAMGERLLGTAVWATAAHETMNSYLSGGLFMVRQLIADHLLAPTDFLGASGVIDAGVNARIHGAMEGAAGNIDNVGSVDEEANAVTAAFAQVLGTIDSDPRRALSRNDGVDARLLGLRDNILQQVFYDGSNPRFEFGHVRTGVGAAGHDFQGRGADKKEVNLRSPIGQVLSAQLNHFPRAVSAFHAAILNDLRFIVGKATTGASLHGSGNAHVYLGVARQ